MAVRYFCFLLLAVLSMSVLAHDIEIGDNGKTIAWTSPLRKDRDVTIALFSEQSLDVFELRYRPVESLTNPVLLTESDATAATKVNGAAVFTVPAPATGFTIYNLWQKTATGLPEADRAAAKRDLEVLEKTTLPALTKVAAENAAQVSIDKLNAEKTKLEAAVTSNAKEIARLDRAIASLEKELAEYLKIPVSRSVDAIREIQAQLRPLRVKRGELAALEEEPTPDPRIAEIEAEIAALEQTPTLVAANAAVTAANQLQHDLKEKSENTNKYKVLKMGVIIAGNPRKALYYNLVGVPVQGTMQVQPVGDVPLLVDGDLIYLIVGKPVEAPVSAFTLTVTTSAGTTIDANPVRPISKIPSLESGGSKFLTANAFEDVVLPFVKPARGNDILKVTLKTQAEIVTLSKTELVTGVADKTSKTTERTSVDLLKDVELPQVHPLYRFNVTTGLAYSGLREPEFEKVQTALEDTTTSEIEARYRIDTRDGNRKARPVLALTFYWCPNDPLQRLTWRERLTPNPTLGLSFTDPTKNIFLGLSNELWRGVQVTWGVHRGYENELERRPDAIEERQSTLPATHEVGKQKFFVGITLNLNFLTKLIKIPS